MTQGAAFRGQPLLLLAGLLLSWLGLRAVFWQPPFEAAQVLPRVVESPRREIQAAAEIDDALPASALPWAHPFEAVPAGVAAPIGPILPPGNYQPVPEPLSPPPSPRAVIGHNLLFMAGLSQMEVPPAVLAYLQGARQPSPGVPAAAPLVAAAPPRLSATPSRWSADGWLMLRRDTTTPILSGRPSYGRSQAGAVIRYRLASQSVLRPQAYLRASGALAGAREQEVAVGLSARPLARLPVRLAVEARVAETARGTHVRPAAFAVTEFAPLKLPLGARAEVYAQGGYVAGDYATAFIDGQARVERPVARVGETEFSAGAGAWGGAQKGAARLDVGPTAAVSFRLGDARGRVAADYRFRVAGEAEPSSGPALTLSAGF